ncbi:MAG TPA: response regulator [Terriglobia bacterium]|nr:response regulator [Terriglobia bacterium]
MRRVLFVQDDPGSREHLQANLRLLRDQMDIHVASSEQTARQQQWDSWEAIIADLDHNASRQVITRAKEEFPEVVRIGLTRKLSPRMWELRLVHQFVRTPWNPDELQVAVERACRLKDLLGDELICRTVGELGELPSIPSVYQQLTARLRDPDVSLHEIAGIIEKDAALSAKLLQLVNSTLFRTASEIATVKTAASYLGLEVIKNLVLSVELFRAFDGAGKLPGFSLEELQAHYQLTMAITRFLPLPRDLFDSALVAALLHDIGILLLAWKTPGRFAKFVECSRRQQRPLHLVEEELWGITHAEIGAYLLGLWGFPDVITEAVAYHHTPARVPHCAFDVTAAVYVADLLAHECEAATAPSRALACSPVDLDFLRQLGVDGHYEGWKALALQQAAARAPAACSRPA